MTQMMGSQARGKAAALAILIVFSWIGIAPAEARIRCFYDHPVTHMHAGGMDIPWERMREGGKNVWSWKVVEELGGEWADWPWARAEDKSIRCFDEPGAGDPRKCIFKAVPCRVP